MVYNWYENPRFGRRNIYTAEREITEENIIQVLQDTYLLHQENVMMIQYLLDYDSGIQPILQRTKLPTTSHRKSQNSSLGSTGLQAFRSSVEARKTPVEVNWMA